MAPAEASTKTETEDARSNGFRVSTRISIPLYDDFKLNSRRNDVPPPSRLAIRPFDGSGNTQFGNGKDNEGGRYKVDAQYDEADVKPEIPNPTHIEIHIVLSNNMPTFSTGQLFAATLR
jgi:hypothetical protein